MIVVVDDCRSRRKQLRMYHAVHIQPWHNMTCHCQSQLLMALGCVRQLRVAVRSMHAVCMHTPCTAVDNTTAKYTGAQPKIVHHDRVARRVPVLDASAPKEMNLSKAASKAMATISRRNMTDMTRRMSETL